MQDQASLLERLRESTARSHAALDKAFSALPLTEREAYARFLEAHYIGVRPLHGAMAEFVADRFGLTAPDYPAMLAADLAELGCAVEDLPAIDPGNKLDAAGVSYVLAGSRLGLATIRKQANWGDMNATAQRYLSDDAGIALWKAIAGYLKQQLPTPEQAESACASAIAAFDHFAAALESRLSAVGQHG